jgi:hypothetical protein
VTSDENVINRDRVTVHAADRGRNVDLYRVGNSILLAITMPQSGTLGAPGGVLSR